MYSSKLITVGLIVSCKLTDSVTAVAIMQRCSNSLFQFLVFLALLRRNRTLLIYFVSKQFQTEKRWSQVARGCFNFLQVCLTETSLHVSLSLSLILAFSLSLTLAVQVKLKFVRKTRKTHNVIELTSAKIFIKLAFLQHMQCHTKLFWRSKNRPWMKGGARWENGRQAGSHNSV